MAARHSSRSVEWFTPPEIVEAARATMGGIDLDPASCESANRVVRAKEYFTRRDDALLRPWHAERVFLNPPGGRDRDRESRQRRWWFALSSAWAHGLVEQAIFVSFSIELLQTCQVEHAPGPLPLDFPICIPASRVQYMRPTRRRVRGGRSSPPHASCVVYLPPREALERAARIESFAEIFGTIGRVVNLDERAGRALTPRRVA